MIDSIAPFSCLSEDIRDKIKEQLREIFYKLPNKIYIHNYSKVEGLDIIVEGSYEVYFYDDDQSKRYIETYGVHQIYGGMSLLFNKGISIQTVDVTKYTRVLRLPIDLFQKLCEEHAAFKEYFVQEFGRRMSQGNFSDYFKKSTAFPAQSPISADIFYAQKVASLNPKSLITCPENMPIHQVAERMAQEKTSCMFVADGKDHVVGYVTDITLRDKVISQKIHIESPVHQVMERDLVSIDIEAYIYEALLLMFQTQTRYMLLSKYGEYIGFISRNKLLSEQSQSPLVFIQSVKLATSLEELKNKWEQVPGIVHHLLERGVKSEIVNQIITAVSDTIALRLIDKAIYEMGPPPSRFVFIILGSEGRKEQTLKTDQDNAIIYEDKANEQRELVRNYFLAFADSVSNDLNYIGFSFCQGDFMAKNPKWTHSLSHWKRNYDNWMTASTQETVMKYSAFFDNRAIYGDSSILVELHEYMDRQLEAPLDKFFFNMANNALQYEPPLTFFKGIRTFNVGEKKVFDIKKAMTPIVDLIRVFALKHRIFETNTGERLKTLADQGQFSEKEYQELRHAYYYLMAMRLDSQATQIIIQKVPPQNVIFLEKLTQIERVALVEVFKVIKNFQLKVKIQFTNSLF